MLVADRLSSMDIVKDILEAEGEWSQMEGLR